MPITSFWEYIFNWASIVEATIIPRVLSISGEIVSAWIMAKSIF